VRRLWPGLGRLLGVVLVVVLVLSVKVVSSSRAELREADLSRSEGAMEAAVTHYRRAARWYLPVQPYADQALDRLLEIGEDAEARGDRALALAAYRGIHGALMSSRSLWVPDRARLHDVDGRIAALMARADVPPVDAHLSEDDRAELYLSMLEEDRDPVLGWSLLALFGLFTWILGAYGVLTRAIDRDDRFVDVELRKWGTAFVVGMGLFVLGLMLA
jgi:hypothetical protein